MSRHTLAFASVVACLSLSACLPDEPTIDATHIRGAVRINPIVRHVVGDHSAVGHAQVLPDVQYRNVVADTALTAGVDAWFASTVATATVIPPGPTAPTGDPSYQLTIVTTWDATGTTATGTTTTTTGTTTTATGTTDTGYGDTGGAPAGGPALSLEVYELVSGAEPHLVKAFDGLTGGHAASTVTVSPGTTYGFKVTGEADGAVTLVLEGNPDAAKIKVGAYLSNDTTALGHPVGGSSVVDYRIGPEWGFTGTYEMVFVKSVGPTVTDTDNGIQSTPVTESPGPLYLFAGNWGNLDAGVRSGTWYSGTPVEVAAGPMVHADQLTLDSFGAAQEGFTVAEVEPNDIDTNTLDLSTAQDVGVLSGLGFVDTITGTMDVDAHDIDAFKFTVPVEEAAYGTFSWAGAGSDFDYYLIDEAGNEVDRAASYDDPEVGGGAVLEPGTTYAALLIMYGGPAGTTEPYTFTLEGEPP